jgi:hypothetical protein
MNVVDHSKWRTDRESHSVVFEGIRFELSVYIRDKDEEDGKDELDWAWEVEYSIKTDDPPVNEKGMVEGHARDQSQARTRAEQAVQRLASYR